MKKAMERRKPYIIAGIPAYNEEKTIAKVILKARKHIDKQSYMMMDQQT